MGCMQSTELSVPNLFQRNLCVHHKVPATDVYKVLCELGKGAFGIVEKVEHLKTKKHYAMKTVTFDTGHKRHEFEKEMDILRGLHHPNIVRMVETYEDDHRFFIIMELAAGGTLLDRVKQRGCECLEQHVKEVVHHLASVVQYLHSRFICHRDLKLENILIESEELGGGIKLCDFGASTLFRMGVTMRKVLGSVVYMAPEVLEGNYTNACDLWSLGIIMYMLLSNTPPFHGATEDELIERIFEAKVSFAEPVWENVSPEAKSLIRKLLTPDPAARYTAAQVLSHPWVKSRGQPIPPEVYDVFVPRVKAFCSFSAFQRAALVAVAFCIPSPRIRKHSDVYNELNIAHNGILTLQELQQAEPLKRFSLDMEKIYQALDQQHESGVNLLEFVAATLGPEEAANEVYLRGAFAVLDREDRGGITGADLKELLGHHFDAAACQEMVRRFDHDKDGKVGFDDFVRMMKELPNRLSRRVKVSHCSAGSAPAGRSSSPNFPPPSPSRRRSAMNPSPSKEATRPQLKHRHSADLTALEADTVLAELRAEHKHQEEVAAELATSSKADAVKRIHSLCSDLTKRASLQTLEADEQSESEAAASSGQVTVEVTDEAGTAAPTTPVQVSA